MNKPQWEWLGLMPGLLLVAVACGVPAFGQCATLSVSQPDEFRKARSLSIRIHPIKVSGKDREFLAKLEPLDALPGQLTQRLRQKLQQIGYFSSVEAEVASRSGQTELLLEGFIANLSPGSVSVPLASGVPSAIEVTLSLQTNAGRRIAEFACTGMTTTGMLTSPKTWMRRSIDRLADKLAKALLQTDEEMKDIPDRTLISATTESAMVIKLPLVLAMRSPEQWLLHRTKYEEQLASRNMTSPLADIASATSPVDRKGTVVAFWRTSGNAAMLSSTYRRFYAVAHRNQDQPPAGDERLSPDEFERKLSEPDQLVLLVMYARKGKVTRWELEKTRSATVLRCGSKSREIKPLLVRNAFALPVVDAWITGKPEDLWTWNSVLMVFPATDAQGQTAVKSLGESMEISTLLDEHPVTMQFDLGKMGLRGPEQLLRERD